MIFVQNLYVYTTFALSCKISIILYIYIDFLNSDKTIGHRALALQAQINIEIVDTATPMIYTSGSLNVPYLKCK